jgi:hypothetical protein
MNIYSKWEIDRDDPSLKHIWYGILFSIFCLAISGIGLIVDERTLQFAPIWLKPLKFSISAMIFLGTIYFILRFIPHDKWVEITAKVFAICLSLELVIIFLQAYRGRMSHFNYQTFEDMILFQIMALAIIVVWIGFGIYTWKLYRSSHNTILFNGLLIGSIITFLSMPIAFLMPQPNAEQLDYIIKNNSPIGGTIGSHTVNEKDPSQTYPITGWAKTGGDLRISHFLSLHSLQVFPLIALILEFFGIPYSKSKKILIALGISYGIFIIVNLIQAMMGIPI